MSRSCSSSANQVPKNTNDRPLCKYFASNCCARGNSCIFSHDRSSKPDMTCRYYLAGRCEYGKSCRYDHIKPKPNTSMSSSSLPLSSTSNSVNRISTKADEETSGDSNISSSKIRNEASSSSDPPFNAWSVPFIGPSSVSHNLFSADNMLNELNCIEDDQYYDANFQVSSPAEIPLCPYHETGYCMNGDTCMFLHGNLCEMCNLNALNPFNEKQRIEHHRQCLADHESAMEAAFAEARSIDKQCGICMEMIVERQLRFGILENCKHCYCLGCIRKWRQHNEQFTKKITRSCPECRVISDYVIPSTTWVEDPEEKQKVIEMYRRNMKQKECKYTKLGRVDDCPFGNKCFYKHQQQNGTVVEGESPRELQRRRRLLSGIQRELIYNSSDDEDAIMAEVIEQIVILSNNRSERNRGRASNNSN